MPIYEYECKSCGRYEVMQKITEEPLKSCEKCGQDVRKLVSLSSFALVGGGWYKDLYGSPKPGTENSTDLKVAKSATSDAKLADAKPDAKVETKAEPKVEAKSESKPAAAPAAA